MNTPTKKHFPLVVWFLGYLFFAIVVGAIAGTAFVDWVKAISDPDSTSKIIRAPESGVRRVQMIFALLPLPWLLRRIGWKGWKDSGWNPGGRSIVRDLLRGWVFAVITLGFVAILSFVFGGRFYDPDPRAFFRIPLFLAVTPIVAIFEETLVRGILFLPLARCWGSFWATLSTSLAFAWAHFLQPAREAFLVEGFLPRVWNVLMTSFSAITHHPYWGVHLLNLALMGIVLCAITARDRAIWTAAGLHTGWVWLKRSVSITSNTSDPIPFAPWIGGRSDFLDSLPTTGVLLILLFWAIKGRNRAPMENKPYVS